MGRSRALNIPLIIAILRESNFSGTVIDLGIGNGVMATCLKNWVEWPIYSNEVFPVIDGVEAFGRYKNPLWDVYDCVFNEDIGSFLKRDDDYDLAIMMDVLEHFDRDEGERVLDQLIDKFEHVIVAVPRGFMPQDAEDFDGEVNEHEAHRSGWSIDDFKDREMQVFVLSDPQGTGLIAVKWPFNLQFPFGCVKV